MLNSKKRGYQGTLLWFEKMPNEAIQSKKIDNYKEMFVFALFSYKAKASVNPRSAAEKRLGLSGLWIIFVLKLLQKRFIVFSLSLL
jgi:hypothetical protein